MANQRPMIKLTNLTKRYGNLIAVKSIDLEVKAGETKGVTMDR